MIDRGAGPVMIALALAAGCGGDDGVVPGVLVGGIEIEEADLGSGIGMTASIYASFAAPREPDLIDDGTCRVYPQPCLGQVGACQAPPQYSAGPIAITGLRAAVTMRPDAESHSYPSPAGLPDDLFADAAMVAATAPGDQLAGFTLTTAGVAPLQSPYVDASLGLTPGQPFALTWTPVASDARIQLRVNWANLCHAGAEWYVLICETADTGSFTVPAAITSALPASGFSQCGARLARFRRATAPDRDVSVTVLSSDFFGFF